MNATWLSLGIAAAALILSALSFRKNSAKEDGEATDQRIDERIQLKLGADIAVIKSDLQKITAQLSNNANIVASAVDATAAAITEAAREMIQIANR